MASIKLTHPIAIAAGVLALVGGFVVWSELGRPGFSTGGDAVPAASASVEPLRAKPEDLATLAAIERRWSDTLDVASRTSRIALAPIVTDLQAQRRAVATADLGACLADLQPALDQRMELEVADYLDFMSSDSSFFVEIERKERAKARQIEASGHRGTIDAVIQHCTPAGAPLPPRPS